MAKANNNDTRYFKLLALTGIILICLGSALNKSQPMMASILIALGGAILGVGAAHWYGILKGRDLMEETKKILKNSLTSKFVSNESDLTPFRKIFHHYHLTLMDEEYVWAYMKINFSKYYEIGTLRDEIKVYNPVDKLEQEYTFHGAVRDERLIITGQIKTGKEPCIIEIFPFMEKTYQGKHSGIMIFQSWDGDNLVSPCIISNAEIIPGAKQGSISAEKSSELNKIWGKRFAKNNQNLVLTNSIKDKINYVG